MLPLEQVCLCLSSVELIPDGTRVSAWTIRDLRWEARGCLAIFLPPQRYVIY